VTGPLSVFSPGLPVFVGGDVPATITAVCVRACGVTYEVAWWSGTGRQCQWVEAHEVTAKAGVPTTAVGFNPGGAP